MFSYILLFSYALTLTSEFNSLQDTPAYSTRVQNPRFKKIKLSFSYCFHLGACFQYFTVIVLHAKQSCFCKQKHQHGYISLATSHGPFIHVHHTNHTSPMDEIFGIDHYPPTRTQILICGKQNLS